MGITLALEDALQTISRNQASGILTVDQNLKITFVRGALSHIEHDPAQEVEGICGLLQDAGCLADSVVELVRSANVAVDQLGKLLVAKQYLSDEEFARAKRAFHKNKLLSRCERDDVRAEFSPDRTVRTSDESLNILAAELLLDVVGMRAARAQLYADGAADGVTFHLAEQYSVLGLTLEEIIVVKLLQATPDLTLEQIERRSLMSKSDLYIALRDLREKGILRAGEEEEILTELDSEEQEEILSDLFDDELESEHEDAVAASMAGIAGVEEDWDDETFSSSLIDEVTQDSADERPPAEFEPESNRWAHNEADGEDRAGFSIGLRLRMLNYKLTETTAVTHVVLVVTILYLVVLAAVLPNELRTWFAAVSEFTQVSTQ